MIYQEGGEGKVFTRNAYNLYVNQNTLAMTIASTGAATFSSRVNINGATDDASYALNIYGDATFSGTRAAPAYIYALRGGDDSKLILKAGSTSGYFSQIDVSGWNGTGTPAYISLNAGSGTGIYINNGNNVLIGTTTATNHKLTVNSSTAASQVRITGTAPTVYFTDTVTDPANYVGLVGLATQTNNFITGSAAGDFVMLNQASGYRLYVVNYSGGVYLTSGATSWTANSDIRLKNINSHIENAVEKLSTLQTINFSYKDDKFKKQNLGLIAQEVEKIFPELIDKNGDEMLGVRYTELVPVLIKAIQELKLEIETLKNK
jgi:hypothetical protein